MPPAERGLMSGIDQRDGPSDTAISSRLNNFVHTGEVSEPDGRATALDLPTNVIRLQPKERQEPTAGSTPAQGVSTSVLPFPLGERVLCEYPNVAKNLGTTAAHAAEIDQRNGRRT